MTCSFLRSTPISREAAPECSLGPWPQVNWDAKNHPQPRRGAGHFTMASTLTNLLVHVVFSTKNREPIITAHPLEPLPIYRRNRARRRRHALRSWRNARSHYLVIRLKAKHFVAEIIKVVKSKSSKRLNANPKRPGRFEWQRGYAAFTVSVSQLENARAPTSETRPNTIDARHFRKNYARCWSAIALNTTSGICGTRASPYAATRLPEKI